MNSALEKIESWLDDPVVCRRVMTTAAWVGLGVMALAPDVAMAAFPVPGVQRLVTDVQDHTTQEGGLIGGTLGIGMGAIRMLLSGFEMGIGRVVQAGAGGAVIGSSPEVATYITGA
jgi:hypothetical protein